MKKLILSLAAAAIVASGFGAYKAYQSYQPKNNLLAMNLEALAQGEGTGSEADSETYQEVKATRTEQTTTEPGWSWDASLKVLHPRGGNKIQRTQTPHLSTFC